MFLHGWWQDGVQTRFRVCNGPDQCQRMRVPWNRARIKRK